MAVGLAEVAAVEIVMWVTLVVDVMVSVVVCFNCSSSNFGSMVLVSLVVEDV